MRGLLDWYEGLGLAPKFLLFIAFLAGAFVVSFVGAVFVLGLLGGGEGAVSPKEDESQQQKASPANEAFEALESIDFEITRTEWRGNHALVEGEWGGEISSVRCDLFEDEERVTDWWNREEPTSHSSSEHTFSQVFVEAEGREIEEPIDPDERYSVACSGVFGDGLARNHTAPVEGNPLA